MSHRYFVDRPLVSHQPLDLPPATLRHVQAVRSQPGETIGLFNGDGREWQATILTMGRSHVSVQVGACTTVDRELPWAVTLAVVVPANERMDWLVEKATELGVSTLQPLLSQRSVVRLTGDRAAKRQAHWAGVAIAAAEQSGRTRVPVVAPVTPLERWLASLSGGPITPDTHWLLCAPRETDTAPLTAIATRLAALPSTPPTSRHTLTVLSGPEGGLSDEETCLALSSGWGATTLGPRTLRADTAPLAALASVASACVLRPPPVTE